MVVALSNLILLLPIASVLAIMLSMTGSPVLRSRDEGVRLFVKVIVWQCVLLGLVGLLARSSPLSLLWLIFFLGFLVQLWFWERGLARNILLLVIGANCQSTNQLNKVVHYLNHEGRGYWRRLGRRFGNIYRATGSWQLALVQSRLARPMRARLALASLTYRQDTSHFHQQLAQTVSEQKQVSQWLGRFSIVSLSYMVLLIAGLLDQFVFPIFDRMWQDLYQSSASELPTTQAWLTFTQWHLHVIIPALVWLALLMLYAVKKIPFFAQRRPVAWMLGNYYRALALEGMADGLRTSRDPIVVCNRMAEIIPVKHWSRKLHSAAKRMSEGRSVSDALARSGVLKQNEAAVLTLCRDAEAMAWSVRELGQNLLERTLRRTHIAVQLLTIMLTIFAAFITAMYAVSTFGCLTALIEKLA